MADHAANVFVWVGEGAVVPHPIVHVRVDPSVLAIPEDAFKGNFETIELHEGVRSIGDRAFYYCCFLREVLQSDGVQSIGVCAFECCCDFTKFRCPPLVTTIPSQMLNDCHNIFSLELPENIIQVDYNAFGNCCSLRNIAIAPNTAFLYGSFEGCRDLLQIFDTEEAIEIALQIDLMDFQFIAVPTIYHTTILSLWKEFAIE